jgi:hypothetical protein
MFLHIGLEFLAKLNKSFLAGKKPLSPVPHRPTQVSLGMSETENGTARRDMEQTGGATGGLAMDGVTTWVSSHEPLYSCVHNFPSNATICPFCVLHYRLGPGVPTSIQRQLNEFKKRSIWAKNCVAMNHIVLVNYIPAGYQVPYITVLWRGSRQDEFQETHERRIAKG